MRPDRPHSASPDASLSPLSGDVVRVAVYPDRAASRERSTVLLAKNVTHWTEEIGDGVALYVPSEQGAFARAQLEAYDEEQRQQAEEARRRPVEAPVPSGRAWPGLVLAGLVLCGVHLWGWWGQVEVAHRWSRDGVAIFSDGEWWRLFTALLVHADLAHLLSNLAFGGLFAWFVVRAYGVWLGWLWLALAGIAANLAVAATFFPAPFAGVGASTAVFAAVGLLVAHGVIWSRGGAGMRRHRSWMLPLGGGLGLLGLFGSGGDSANIDVAAHLFGFGAGLLMGMIVASIQRWRPRRAGGG